MKTNSLCSDDSLRLLLRADEQSGDYRDAARHVDSCPHCQQRIGELAAEDDEWHEAHEMLLAGDESGSGNIGVVSAQERSRGRWQRGPTAWTEAMARQLLSLPSHPEMLGRIGRYEVERLIGAGGMGVVFKAFDSELNRPVAVKLLSPYLAGSGAARRRFAREARAAAAVVHEHVVAIHNVETDGDVPFLVMPYVPGESLQSRLDREGALDVCEILRIGMQTASGLAAAHAQGLVHRDVKPANVLLEKGVERSLLTDFGLARASDDASLTRTGHHLGTPQYMSPEQAFGDAVDARSDLFSLGSVMYAMCTGRPPFRAESSYGVLRRITDSEPRPIREINPNIPDWLEAIIVRLLAKSVESRWQTAAEVAELLQRCLAHVQQPAVVALPTECRSQRKWFLQRRFVVAGLVVLALAAAIPVGQSLISSKPMDPNGASGSITAGDTDSDSQSSASATDFSWDAASIASQALADEFTTHESRADKLWDEPAQPIAPSHAVENDRSPVLPETNEPQ